MLNLAFDIPASCCLGVICGGLFQATIATRTVKHIYVFWFYSAFIITIAVLHIVNNLALFQSTGICLPHLSGAAD
jgi:cbb3-type cytochrome oxidase subunit 1